MHAKIKLHKPTNKQTIKQAKLSPTKQICGFAIMSCCAQRQMVDLHPRTKGGFGLIIKLWF